MSLQKLPPRRDLTFAEQHPVAIQIWRDTLKVSREQVIIPGVMTAASFIIDLLQGQVTSVGSAALSLLYAVLVGLILYVLINVIRAPFIVIGQHHRKIVELSERLREIEPSTHIADISASSAPAQRATGSSPAELSQGELKESEAKPHIVSQNTEMLGAHINRHGEIIEGPSVESTDRMAVVIAALFHNQPTRSRMVGGIGSVSAQLIYKLPDARYIQINRGVWLAESSPQVAFGPNDHHRVVLTIIYEAEQPLFIAVQREYNSIIRKWITREIPLNADSFEVEARLVSESEGRIIHTSRFRFELTSDDIKVNRMD